MKIRILTALLLLATPVLADLAGAQKAYKTGQQLETSRDYPTAITFYEATLREFPDYHFAHRQLGNCYYYTGKKEQALEHYEKYLAVSPTDDKVQSFVAALKGSKSLVVDRPKRMTNLGHEVTPEPTPVALEMGKGKLHIGASFAFSLVDPSEINPGFKGGEDINKMYGGTLDIGWEILPGWGAGIRTGWESTNVANVSSASPGYRDLLEFKVSVIPIGLGGWKEWRFDRAAVRPSAYAGIALTSISSNFESESAGIVTKTSSNQGVNAFLLDLGVDASFAFSNRSEVFAAVGYRVLGPSQDSMVTDLTTGFTKIVTTTVDISGIGFRAGVRFRLM